METDPLSRRSALRALALASTGALVSSSSARSAAVEPSSASVAPRHHVPPELRMGAEQIAILVYPEFTALDALGPHYALAGMMGASVRFVAKTRDPVPSEGAALGGFQVRPHLTFSDCPDALDLLLVPGGLTGTFAAIEDAPTRRFLADRERRRGW